MAEDATANSATRFSVIEVLNNKGFKLSNSTKQCKHDILLSLALPLCGEIKNSMNIIIKK